MAFNKEQARENLRSVLFRIESIEKTLENDILEYRSRDTIEDEDDEYKTMRDIRFYALKAYRGLDELLNFLDRYK